MIIIIIQCVFYTVVTACSIYAIRHYIFSFSRLFGKQLHPYIGINRWTWPSVTILIPAHNEEAVIADLLTSLVHMDYPKHLLQIIVINDRSIDRTEQIILDFVARYPDLFVIYNRRSGISTKAAILKDAHFLAKNDILLFFDADYLPERSIIKQLTSPFCDPEIGATMGRVIPSNTGKNFLTRSLDIERSTGYQVNQQARMNIGSIPQFGGTTGALRKRALEEIGGWNERYLSEDTEITFRLLCNGWKTAYINYAECYEEVPDTWAEREKQITRWTKGHNQVLASYFFPLLISKYVNWIERLDGILLLSIYLLPVCILIGWVTFFVAYYLHVAFDLFGEILSLFAVVTYGTASTFSIFQETSTAISIDNKRNFRRVRLLPLSYFNFFTNMVFVCKAFVSQFFDVFKKNKSEWHRTQHTQRQEEK